MADIDPWGTPDGSTDDAPDVAVLRRRVARRAVLGHYAIGLFIGASAGASPIIDWLQDPTTGPGSAVLREAAGLTAAGLPVGLLIHGGAVVRDRRRARRRRSRLSASKASQAEYREIPLPGIVTHAHLTAGAGRVLVWAGRDENPPLHMVLDTSTAEVVWARPRGADVLNWGDLTLRVTRNNETWAVRTLDGSVDTGAAPARPRPRRHGPPERKRPPQTVDRRDVSADRLVRAGVDRDGLLRVVDVRSGKELLLDDVEKTLDLGFTDDSSTLVVVLSTSIRRYPIPARG